MLFPSEYLIYLGSMMNHTPLFFFVVMAYNNNNINLIRGK